MKNSLRNLKRSTGVAAAFLGASALVLTGCGAAPEAGGGSAAPEVDYTACMVSDEGGFDDRSFNQASHEGLTQARTDLGVKINQAESNAGTDMKPNIESMVSAGCDIIVTAGFLIGDATLEAAEKYPDTKFAIVDYGYEENPANLRTLNYKTDEAAFLAGYAAAAYSKSGKVGTFGGAEIPTVTIFMDGFLNGVNHFNEVKGADVQVVGWGSSKSFVGNFSDAGKARQLSDNMLAEGVDVIMPVAGPLGQAAVDAVNESSSADDTVVWVDTDGFDYANNGQDVVLTSVMKEMGKTVEESIKLGLDDTFTNDAYMGTLENGGVSIAPFHNFADKVPAELQGEIDQLKQDIIDGTVSVGS
ncbi:BMP family lipoprotein [Zafaria sp. Z1313]|uniref:BMP family lipoprotein n=1 Tax=unclassified Zafaria TaxID=2828765 RepID=UPI002E7A5DD7|nr:BMP family ABC transporter substrate-binding protein [Zafaria sp. J156]MEE1619897.1 BMP family ABC transporter substrate-binding protein [Zafaria sp. J156]